MSSQGALAASRGQFDTGPSPVGNAERRQRVIAAAIDVFASTGYGATTVDRLISAAGIGVGSFYDHFGGKEECFAVALERVIMEGEEAIAPALASSGSWPERVRAVVLALVELTDARPAAARLFFLEAQSGPPMAAVRFQACLVRAASALKSGRALIASGNEVPPKFELTLVGGAAWILGQRAGGRSPASSLPSSQLATDLAQLLLDPYGLAADPGGLSAGEGR